MQIPNPPIDTGQDKPDAPPTHHKQILWTTIIAIAVFIAAAYVYTSSVPSVIDGKQASKCAGAKQSLADFQNPRDGVTVDPSKIKDAQDLVEVECSKT